MRLTLTLWLVLSLWSCLARAHERSESESHWSFQQGPSRRDGTGELHGIITAWTREVTRLMIPGDDYASLPGIFAAHVGKSVTAAVDGIPCSQHRPPALLASAPGHVRVDVSMSCHTGNQLMLRLETFFTVAPSHHHFLYIEASDDVSREAILTASAATVELELRAPNRSDTTFARFAGMGLEHILSGIDHLAFLLALLISVRTWKQALAIVTGFTLGHSLTLSLAMLGMIEADRGAVESLIGLTVALAAAFNLIRGESEGRIAGLAAIAVVGSLLLIPEEFRADMPALLVITLAFTTASAMWLAGMQTGESSLPARFGLATTFGLVHGLGFAGALQELRLPASRLLATLLGFNVGVELGQLLLVSGAAALLRVTTLTGHRSQVAATMASAVLVAAGLTWFLTRVVT